MRPDLAKVAILRALAAAGASPNDQSTAQGSAGRGVVKGVFDPLGGLARTPLGIRCATFP